MIRLVETVSGGSAAPAWTAPRSATTSATVRNGLIHPETIRRTTARALQKKQAWALLSWSGGSSGLRAARCEPGGRDKSLTPAGRTDDPRHDTPRLDRR